MLALQAALPSSNPEVVSLLVHSSHVRAFPYDCTHKHNVFVRVAGVPSQCSYCVGISLGTIALMLSCGAVTPQPRWLKSSTTSTPRTSSRRPSAGVTPTWLRLWSWTSVCLATLPWLSSARSCSTGKVATRHSPGKRTHAFVTSFVVRSHKVSCALHVASYMMLIINQESGKWMLQQLGTNHCLTVFAPNIRCGH